MVSQASQAMKTCFVTKIDFVIIVKEVRGELRSAAVSSSSHFALYLISYHIKVGTNDKSDGFNDLLGSEKICFDTKVNFLSSLLKKM